MYEIYVIKEGDTINSIASRLNIDPSILYQINGFTNEYVPNFGSSIIIPVMRNSNFEYYTIKKGDSLYSIAKSFNTDINTLAKVNGLNPADYIYPNQTIIVPKNGVQLYFVKENDTLANVASNFRTDVVSIIRQNDRIFLQPEQIIVFRENNI